MSEPALPTVSRATPRSVSASAASSPGNSISALRLLLATVVVYDHVFLLGGFSNEPVHRWSHGLVGAGTLAVQAFFVISGSLVAASYLRLASLRAYLWHRLLRLAPAWWVCLVVTAFMLAPLLAPSTGLASGSSYFSLEPSAWGYVGRNLFKARAQISIGHLPLAVPWPGDLNGSLWTLSYEMAGYGLIALWGLAGLLGRFRRLGAVLVLALVGLQAAWVALPAGTVPAPFVRLVDTPGKSMTILFFAGTLWTLFPQVAAWLGQRRWPAVLALALFVASLRLGCHAALAPFTVPILIFSLAARLPWRNFETTVKGDYSYGLYLYSYPVGQVLAHFRVHEAGFAVFLTTNLLAAGALAFASWHLVERPCLALKSLVQGRARIAA